MVVSVWMGGGLLNDNETGTELEGRCVECDPDECRWGEVEEER